MVPWIPAFTGMTKKVSDMCFVEVPLDSRFHGNDKKGGCQVFALVPWIPDQVRDDKAG